MKKTDYDIVFADGAFYERERIIKLLEPYTGCRDEWCGTYCDCPQAGWVIALIKGEK